MRTTKLAMTLFAAVGISTLATPVMAYEAGDWLVRGRIINVNPNDDSGIVNTGIGSVGEGVETTSDTIPELDITYMITPHWGVELILGYSEHTVKATNSARATVETLGHRDLINTKVLPPTLLLQYHFLPNSNFRPYVGAGINYTHFFDESVPSKSGISNPGDSIDLDDSWGWAVQAGIDIAINEDWFVNADVKYIDIDTSGSFKNTAVGWAKVNTDLDPVVFGLGIGRRF
jgi:outer membrane protein